MRRSIKQVVNALLEPTGYALSRTLRPAASPAGPTNAPNRNLVALESALTRITGRGLEINTIIDVGASNGQWTNLAHPFFPQAAALLVEANPVHEASLRQFTQKNAYAKYVIKAAGDTTGEIYFDAGDPFSGLASHTPLAVPTITVPVTTIDSLVEERGLRPPFLIKLDTHGFEVPILQGAERALSDTHLLIVETYVFQIIPTSLKFYEICQLLSTRGFATIDFCDPMWRVRDNSFWQFDLIFIRDDRKELSPTAMRDGPVREFHRPAGEDGVSPMPPLFQAVAALCQRLLARAGLALAALALTACGTAQAAPLDLPRQPRATQRPVFPTAEGNTPVSASVASVGPTPSAVFEGGQGGEGLDATAAAFLISVGTDPTGAKTAAFTTLKDFINPHGIYSRAWWLADDGHASLAEVLAVILYTEGNTAFEVRTAVAARYLWYCGGLGSTCQGANLINYLSYFQPWREPWNSSGFTSDNSKKYLSLAEELVYQAPGMLTAMIPGADTYVQSEDGPRLAGPIDWNRTKFHFANVDPTWDTHLRQQLRRLPDGPNRLWVLTMGDASKVCGSQFLCADMTQPRQSALR